MSKHRAPRYVRTKKVIAAAPVAASVTAVGLGVFTASPASAATPHDWSDVAQCESGGNWSINTGNGYSGGLQFSQSTWAGYGGNAIAARADLASPAQQIEIAEKVLAGQGAGAWPVCGRFLSGGSTAVASAPAAPATASTTDHQDADSYGRHAASGDDYTVVSGDTISKIAIAHEEAWRDLYQRNVGVIGANPNLIVPGQVLALTGTTHSRPSTTAGHSAPTASATATTARTTATRVAPAAVVAPAASSVGVVAEKVAMAQLGRPYVSGGESPSGFDCSGLVQYAYARAGVGLPRTTGAQISAGTPVSEANLQVGDLVFFYGGTHVGIYIGNGQVVHAPVPGDVVKVTSIAYMPFYAARHIG